MRSASAFLVMGMAVAAACGGSTSSQNDGNNNGNNPNDGGSNDAGATNPGTALDSGSEPPALDSGSGEADAPPSDPGSDTYPADHPPIPLMQNAGGAVLTDVKLVTVTFVGNTSRDDLRKFDDGIVASDWWTTVTRGYDIHKGTGGVYAELPDTVSNTTLDNDKDLKPFIQKAIDAGQLPTPDANTLYAIYFPASTTITLQDGGGTGPVSSCHGFGAYHDSMSAALEGGKVEAAFAVIPDCGGGLQGSASHEFIEAATDPHPNASSLLPTYYMFNDAWSPMGVLGGEVADQCEGRGPFTTPEGWDVARSWVNAAAKESKDPCQPTDPGKIFFAAAVASETQHYVDPNDATNNHDSEGYITIKVGTTKTLDVVVFSEAKLPHDLQLVVGKARSNPDPTQVSAIATGITATLSATTGRNGQHRTLTIAAAADAATGDHKFVVRAILEQNDYHSWPLILRVQ